MIIVRLKGGMGNQMFQYTLGRALSLKYNVPLKLDLSFLSITTPRLNLTLRNYDLDVFNIKADIVPLRNICFTDRLFKGLSGKIFESLRLLSFSKGVEHSFCFNPYVLNIGPNGYLDGYWQSPKYFEGIEDIIREDFTFKNKFSDKIIKLGEEIKSCNSLCVHVRRGDYVGNKNHEIVGKEYYNKAIEKMKTLTKIDKIYVFSDDIKWCEENMNFEFPTMFVNKQYTGEKNEGHLFLMTQCKNFIIPNSTFSWWGAWLSDNKNKVVIVPKKWFPFMIFNKDDIVLKEWIRI